MAVVAIVEPTAFVLGDLCARVEFYATARSGAMVPFAFKLFILLFVVFGPEPVIQSVDPVTFIFFDPGLVEFCPFAKFCI
jgi:hypothetical protein